jgi:hypothetical protein
MHQLHGEGSQHFKTARACTENQIRTVIKCTPQVHSSGAERGRRDFASRHTPGGLVVSRGKKASRFGHAPRARHRQKHARGPKSSTISQQMRLSGILGRRGVRGGSESSCARPNYHWEIDVTSRFIRQSVFLRPASRQKRASGTFYAQTRHDGGMTFQHGVDPLRTRTCSRDTQTHAETRPTPIANICGRRGSRAKQIRRGACSAAVSSKKVALRRRTPHARAASPKQRAPPEITRTQLTNAHRECISVPLGAGDAKARPDAPGGLLKSRHQSAGASSR